MQKVYILLSCPDSPLEEKVFSGEKTFEINIIDYNDTETLLSLIEPLILNERGDSTAPIIIKAMNEDDETVLTGTVREGFRGVSIQ